MGRRWDDIGSLTFTSATAACRRQEGACYRHFGFTLAARRENVYSTDGRRVGDLWFFPSYTTHTSFTPPSDNLYFRFLRRIAPGLPGVGNRPCWPTRAACLIVCRCVAFEPEFQSLACFRTKVKNSQGREVRKREADVETCTCIAIIDGKWRRRIYTQGS